jgi:hypothetical protein
MQGRRHYHLGSRGHTCNPDLITVGGYDAAVRDIQGCDPLPDADDDRNSSQKAEGLAGEASGRQTGRNDRERCQQP